MAAGNRHITLPPFWAENAAGWFAHVEARFRAKGIYDEWDRFDFAVAALSKEVIQLCFSTVTNPDEDKPYYRRTTSSSSTHSQSISESSGCTASAD